MLKNKFKLVALLTLIILALAIPIVNAVDEEVMPINEANTTEDGIMPINVEGENAQTTSDENNMKNSDVYLFGDTVTIDYIVDGNVFVFANKVVINSQIGGNVFVCAQEVNVEKEGFIVSSLFGYAEKINISGIVCDLYAAAKNVEVTGYIYRDMRVGSETLNLGGVVGRDVFVQSDKITFDSNSDGNSDSSQLIIGGNFNYSAKEEMSIPENIVKGSVNFEKISETENTKSISSYILDLGTFVCTVAIIWLLALWLTPKFVKEPCNILSKKILPALGYGILTPIILILAFVMLLVLGLTINIALLILVLLCMLFAISTSSFVITINGLVCSKLKIEKSTQSFGILIISAVIYWLITLIPVISTIISLISVIIGLGVIVYNIIPSKSKNNKTEVVETKTEDVK